MKKTAILWLQLTSWLNWHSVMGKSEFFWFDTDRWKESVDFSYSCNLERVFFFNSVSFGNNHSQCLHAYN